MRGKRALSSFYEFTVQSTFDSFELKRTSVVYGIGVSIALVYVPTAIYKMEGLSQRTSMLSRSTLTLIAPGLLHVIDALDHPRQPIPSWRGLTFVSKAACPPRRSHLRGDMAILPLCGQQRLWPARLDRV